MTIEQANEYFSSLPEGFAPAEELRAALTADVQKVQFVGVAGTAGKTAAAGLLAAILREAAFHVGFYRAGCEPLSARIAIGGVSVDPVLLCQAAEALSAAKPLPREAAELAAAVLWCALTLGTDRLFFRYDWRTPAFFVYKALFLVLAFGLVHGAVTLVQKLRAGDKFARRWVAWTLPYLAVNLVILLIVWPGIWGNDDLAVLYLARTLQPNSWQHFLTSGAFILSLMFVPMPGGVVLVQNLLISGIVGLSLIHI